MKLSLQITAAALAAALISACSSQGVDQPVPLAPKVTVPGDLSQQVGNGGIYAVPEGPAEPFAEVPRPRALSNNNDGRNSADEGIVDIRHDGNNVPFLVLYEDFAHVWEDLSLAAASTAYGLADQDRSKGVLYLNTWVDGEPNRGRPIKGTKKQYQYQLHVVRTANDIEVSVQTDTDTLASLDIAEIILADLKQQLDK